MVVEIIRCRTVFNMDSSDIYILAVSVAYNISAFHTGYGIVSTLAVCVGVGFLNISGCAIVPLVCLEIAVFYFKIVAVNSSAADASNHACTRCICCRRRIRSDINHALLDLTVLDFTVIVIVTGYTASCIPCNGLII